MPQGTPRSRAVADLAAARRAGTSGRAGCPGGARMTSAGIRYSNIEPTTRPARSRADRRQRRGRGGTSARGHVALGDRDEARQARLGGEQVVVARVEPAVGDAVADREELAARVEEEARSPSRGQARAPTRRSSQAPRERAGRPRRAEASRRALRRCRSRGVHQPARLPRALASRQRASIGRGGDRPSSRRSASSVDHAETGPGQQRIEVAAMARDGRRTASAQVSSSAAAPSPRSAVSVRGHVRERVRARAASSREAAAQPSGVAGGAERSARPRSERLVELLARDASASAGRRRSRGRRSRTSRARRRCRRASGGPRWQRRSSLAAGLGEREQVAGEVAAVDRRHVPRLERMQRRACRTSCRGARGSARGRRASASVASRRSTISSVPIQPKSWAATVDSSYSPMFVGEVRCATTGLRVVLEVVRRQPDGPPGRRRSRRSARSGGRSSGARASSAADSGRAARRGRRQADPARDERREAARGRRTDAAMRPRRVRRSATRTRAAAAASATPPAIGR